jgi:hypothetical protein
MGVETRGINFKINLSGEFIEMAEDKLFFKIM